MTSKLRDGPRAVKILDSMQGELHFALGVGDDARAARKLVREPVRSFGEQPSVAPDAIDRQLDKLDRKSAAFYDVIGKIADEIAPGKQESLRAVLWRETARRLGIPDELPDALPAPAGRARRSGAAMVLRPLLISGTFRGDLQRADLPPDEISESDRAAAIQRIAARFPRLEAVYRARWPAVRDALQREAGDWPAQNERLRRSVESAIALVASEVQRLPALDAPRELRRRLNALVTEDLAGGWRYRHREDDLDPVSQRAEAPPEAGVMEQRLELEQLIARAALSPGEAAVVASFLDDEAIEDYARRRGIAPPTARVQKARALGKLRRAAGL